MVTVHEIRELLYTGTLRDPMDADASSVHPIAAGSVEIPVRVPFTP
jgi:hypothetical protein